MSMWCLPNDWLIKKYMHVVKKNSMSSKLFPEFVKTNVFSSIVYHYVLVSNLKSK